MKEEITSTQDIFDGRIVHLKVHDVTLPDGNTSKREVIYHQGAAAIVAIDDEQQVLLVKQYRIAVRQITLELPAGILELDENPAEAVSRELREETGYRPLNVESIGGIYVAPAYTTEFIHLFFAKGYIYDPLPQDDDEFVEPIRMPIQQALAMIETGEIIEAKTVTGLLRIARRLGL